MRTEAREPVSPQPEMVELSALVAFYNLATRLLVAFGIEHEEGRSREPLPP